MGARMTEAPTLWEKLPADDPTDESLDARFARFHRDNPGVYERLLSLAEQVYERGHRNVSMRDMFGWMRLERMLTRVATDEPYVLNNSFTSRYARLIMEQNPHLEGTFEIRELKS